VGFRWRRLRAVLLEAWPTWVAIGGIALAAVLGWITSTSASGAIRYAGTVLQVFGLLTIAVGLRHMRKLFGRPTVPRRVRDWFGRFAQAFRRPEPVTLKGTAAGIAMVTGEARVRLGAGAGASLEQRLSVLESNLNQLQDELDAKICELRSKSDEMRNDLRREGEERRAADDTVSRRIEEVAIGGLHLEIVGLVWLMLGVIGASVPDEVAALIQLIR
jgi:hypothetical protein